MGYRWREIRQYGFWDWFTCWLRDHKLWWTQEFHYRFTCPRNGHDYYHDMCMKPAHDICSRCDRRREENEAIHDGH